MRDEIGDARNLRQLRSEVDNGADQLQSWPLARRPSMSEGKIYHSTHRCSFVELDPFGHMNTLHYLSHYLEHRFIGMREVSGLNLKAIHKLPIIFVTKDVKIEFIRAVLGDDIFHITSQVTEMTERDCRVDCDMKNSNDQLLSKCQFTFTCVDKHTQKSVPWPVDIKTYFFD